MIAYLQLAGSMMTVGANVAIAKAILVEMPASLLAWLRFILIGLLLLPAPLRLPGSIWRLAVQQWLTLFGLALFGVVLFNLAMLYGLRLTSATDAAIVTSAIPAVVALLSIPLLGEKPGWRGSVAITLSMAGMLVVSLPASADSSGAIGGNALIFGAVLSEALYIVASRKLGSAFPVFFTIWLLNAVGAIAMAPLAVYEWRSIDLARLPASIWGLTIVYSLSAGLLAFVLWFTGIRRVQANRAGLFTGLLPISAALTAVTALGEEFTLAHATGMALVLAAIGLGATIGGGDSGQNRESQTG